MLKYPFDKYITNDGSKTCWLTNRLSWFRK